MKNTLTACALLLLLLLTACGQTASLQETIPTLSLTAGSGRAAPVSTFGYSWTAGRDSLVVDTVHPLEAIENLPGVSVTAGTPISMYFSRLPGIVTVTCWPASDAETPSPEPGETVEASFANNLFTFIPPDSEENLVFLVEGQWNSRDDAKGTVCYAFVVEQK